MSSPSWKKKKNHLLELPWRWALGIDSFWEMRGEGSSSGSCFPKEIPNQDTSPEEESSIKQRQRAGDLSRAHSCSKCEHCSDLWSMCAVVKVCLAHSIHVYIAPALCCWPVYKARLDLPFWRLGPCAEILKSKQKLTRPRLIWRYCLRSEAEL